MTQGSHAACEQTKCISGECHIFFSWSMSSQNRTTPNIVQKQAYKRLKWWKGLTLYENIEKQPVWFCLWRKKRTFSEVIHLSPMKENKHIVFEWQIFITQTRRHEASWKAPESVCSFKFAVLPVRSVVLSHLFFTWQSCQWLLFQFSAYL